LRLAKGPKSCDRLVIEMRRLHPYGVLLALAALAPSCSSTKLQPTMPGDDAGSDDGSMAGDAAGDAGGGDGAAPPQGCNLPPASTSSTYQVRFDQVGYVPEGAKWAVVLGAGAPAPAFQILDASGAMIGSGTAGPRVLSTTSMAGAPLTGDRIDLSAITTPGKYTIALADGTKAGPVIVDPNAYAPVLPLMLRFLGAQRCGQTTAAISQHGPCHLFASVSGNGAFSGDGIAVADGYTGNVDTNAGAAADVEGGWHDAGDFVKFLNTTAFVLAVDLLALRDHATAFKGARLGGTYDALRAEMRWGLDWVVKMLGGAQMYHQVSGAADHDVGWRIPEADTTTPVPGYTQRPAFQFASGQGGNLLGRSAAALALGSQVFADDAAYASKLLTLAKTAYAAGGSLGMPQSSDPVDFYNEGSVDDDLSLAAAVLAQVTSDPTYLADALTHARALEGPAPMATIPLQWGDLSALAFLETGLAEPAASAERTEMAMQLNQAAALMVSNEASPSGPGAAFHYAMATFGDGSIEESLGAASVCLASKKLGGSATCAEIARAQVHWMLGQNPFGESFMVGAAPTCPINLHHSLAQAAQITLVGAIAGGPTSIATLQGNMDPNLPIPNGNGYFAPWSTPALVYEDVLEDYVMNEPAIDFTAPLVFVLGELLDGP
jgi:endoglucanase